MQKVNDPPNALVPVRANNLLAEPVQTAPASAITHKIPKVRYWQILWRNKLSIAGVCALGCALGFGLTLFQAQTYQARTTMEIETPSDAFPTFSSYTKPGDSGTDIQTQMEILRSRTLLKRVAAKMDLSPVKTPGDPGILSRFRLAMHGGRQPDMAAAISLAVRSVVVKPVPGTRVIDISIDSTVPAVAANFANTLVDEFTTQNIDSKWQESLRRAEWLSRQMDEMRAKMEQSEGRLQEYAKNARVLFSDDKTSVSEDRLRQVQEALSTAQADRAEKESKLEMLSTGSADSLPDILDDEGIRGYEEKMAELRRQIAELSVIYTPENVKLRSLQMQLLAMKDSYRQARETIGSKIRNQYEQSLRRERMLKADYVDQTTLVLGEGEKTLHYQVLKSEVDSNRQFYDTMLQQLKQSTIASAMRASNIHTVDVAEVPKKPYKPNSAKSVLTGGFLGILSAAAFVLLRDRANQTIRDIGETTDFLGIPELGIIPRSRIVRRPVRTELFPKSLPARIELTTWQLQTSAVAESFRSTLVSLLLFKADSQKAHRFVVVSASPNEGKTTVVCNLALAMAEMGDRVLIVDADLRKPRLHEVFGMDATPGLSDLFNDLAGRKGELDLSKYLRPTSVPRLFVLAAGKATSSSTSLLFGKLLPEVLELIGPGFDKVLIDTPPMLEIPDARVVAKHADSVILVVRAGKTTRDAILAAYNKFMDDGTEILGSVVNDWNPVESSAGYYGYGYKYYGPKQKPYNLSAVEDQL